MIAGIITVSLLFAAVCFACYLIEKIMDEDAVPDDAPGSRNYAMAYICQHGDNVDKCPVCRH